MIRMVVHAQRAQLVIESTPPRFLRRLRTRSLVVTVPFSLSIVAVLVPGIGESAYYLWWFGPPLMSILFTVRRKWRERRGVQL